MENENKGIRLLKKGKKGLFRVLFSRIGIVTVLILVEAFMMLAMLKWFNEYYPGYYGLTTLFTFCMVIYLLNMRMNPTAKITWLILIMLFPLLGAAFLGWTRSNIGHRSLKKRVLKIVEETDTFISQDEDIIEKLKDSKPEAVALANYINRSGCYPVYDNTQVKYFSSGEEKFEEMLKQLKMAKHFIFLEYFIIDEGVMWGKILEILSQKVDEGVEVRVMYDGTCEYTTLTSDYTNRLAKLGIKSMGHFEADGGLNEPMVMYTRDPGMIIEYSITGAWVKNIPSPESENDFLFAFYMPDTRKHIKSDLSVKEFAGKTLGEYLRACEASDHMGWADPAKMQIVDRIQKNTVNRIVDLTTNEAEQKVEATASRLSGKLGRMLLPRVGYAKRSGGNGGSGGGGGGKIKDISFETLSQEYIGEELVIEFLLQFSHAKKNVDVSVIVDSESGRIDPAAWQKDIGTPFPANITALKVHSIKSPIIENGLNMDAACNSLVQKIENEYVKAEINHAENSAEFSSFSVSANVLNLELKGAIRIKARDKKYKFSLRIV